MEFVRDQAQYFVPVVVEPGEESLHRRLEAGEGGKVFVVDVNRGLLEQPPDAFDQVQIRRIWRQVEQFNAASSHANQALTAFEWLYRAFVQHHPDRARRRVPRLQVLERQDHLGAGDPPRLTVYEFAAGLTQRTIDVDVGPAVIAFQFPCRALADPAVRGVRGI